MQKRVLFKEAKGNRRDVQPCCLPGRVPSCLCQSGRETFMTWAILWESHFTLQSACCYNTLISVYILYIKVIYPWECCLAQQASCPWVSHASPQIPPCSLWHNFESSQNKELVSFSVPSLSLGYVLLFKQASSAYQSLHFSLVQESPGLLLQAHAVIQAGSPSPWKGVLVFLLQPPNSYAFALFRRQLCGNNWSSQTWLLLLHASIPWRGATLCEWLLASPKLTAS